MFRVAAPFAKVCRTQKGFASIPASTAQYNGMSMRLFSADASVEAKITGILEREFNPTLVQVKDVSGGCGAMFDITVVSEKFKGVSLVNQHKMVTRVLSTEIKDMHGLMVKTSVPAL